MRPSPRVPHPGPPRRRAQDPSSCTHLLVPKQQWNLVAATTMKTQDLSASVATSEAMALEGSCCGQYPRCYHRGCRQLAASTDFDGHDGESSNVLLSWKVRLIYCSLAHARQFWNEWEIQCLVLVSFGLQVFLHLFSSIRKSKTSRLLSLLLWLAYLSADYVATFTLGRLALHVGDPRHQLMLFWTPLLLLHLGSQETIAAFSIEDAMLWKRHLLGLVTQVALAIYIVAKSWRPDRQLLAPLVLMFISGTIKYAERTWALMTASSSMQPGGDSTADHVMGVQDDVIIDAKSYCHELLSIFPGKDADDMEVRNGRRRRAEDDKAYEGLVIAAGKGLRICLDFLTDMTPFLVWSKKETIIDRTVDKLRSSDSDTQVQMAYKLVEIQLSLIYDYMYTKYGAFQFRLGLASSGIERLITFCSTSAALGLFVGANLQRPFNYRREDVIVSYVLLAGAVTLDISSIFMLISSYWLHLHRRGSLFGCAFSLAKCVRPWSKPLWSEKIAQYNLIDACIQEQRGGGAIIGGWVMRRTGIVSDLDMSNTVSPELKKLVLDKLFEVATTRSVSDYWDWDFSKYRGMWLQWWLEEGRIQDEIGQGLLNDGITDSALYFPMTVIVWHIATEMCWFADEDDRSPCRGPSMEMSRYVMYLVAKCNVMSGSNGQFELGKARRQVKRILQVAKQDVRDERELLQYARHAPGVTEPCFGRGRAITNHLLKISNRAQRWELICTVWVEMLCYLGPNCGAQFHAKHLCTGGEFVTHVRILLVVLGIPFLRSDMKPGKF